MYFAFWERIVRVRYKAVPKFSGMEKYPFFLINFNIEKREADVAVL